MPHSGSRIGETLLAGVSHQSSVLGRRIDTELVWTKQQHLGVEPRRIAGQNRPIGRSDNAFDRTTLAFTQRSWHPPPRRFTLTGADPVSQLRPVAAPTLVPAGIEPSAHNTCAAVHRGHMGVIEALEGRRRERA